MNCEKLNPEKYLTPQEIADYLHINVKAARAYFIVGKRVDYIKVGHKYMILRSSFLEWEAATRTKAKKMW
jgi:hypothetical protein